MDTPILAKIRPGRRYVAAAMLVLFCIMLVLAFSAVALADEGGSNIPTAEGKQAPKLDYTFQWWSFVLTAGMVIVFLIIVFRVSETEFKKVVDAHFGPKDWDGR